jgi:hypothetical protein
MSAQQLLIFGDFVEEPLEGQLIRRVKELEEKLDRQRKGQFAKIGQLRKDYDSLIYEFETLKAAICRSI